MQRRQPSTPRARASFILPNLLLRIVRAEDERRWEADDLGALFNDPRAAVRGRAALAAGRIGDARAVAPLAALLRADTEAGVRAWAAFALGEIESVQGTAALIEVINDGATPPEVRARAVEALGKIAAALPKTDEANARAVGEAILSALTAEQQRGAQADHDIVLLGLTAALRARPLNAARTVACFLQSPDARVRADALNTLARLRAKEVQEATRALLMHDADPVVRANAARALGAAEDKPSFALLLDRAANDQDQRVRVSALRAVGQLQDTRATDTLLKRAEVLFTADRAARAKEIAHPAESNELWELATTLGRVQANAPDERALAFLRSLRVAEHFAAPEVEIAFARIAPALYMRERPFVNSFLRARDNQLTWQAVDAVAAGLGEIANATSARASNAVADAQAEAQLALRAILIDKTTPALAAPTVLRSLAAFKPIDAGALLRAQLVASDVMVRATAAELLGELPPTDDNAAALVVALPAARQDTMNDAALAILDALGKQKTVGARDAIKGALDSPDYLIRRRADALTRPDGAGAAAKANANVDNSRFQTVASRNRDADYRRALARTSKRVVAVVATDKGAFTLELLPEAAPLTVDNFVELARRGFFNHVLFHRVVANFVIQGGDPRGDGNGGPGYQIRCEINTVPYARGAVGMALSGKDTGGSQWFVTHSPQPHLDGGYTVFAHVISGMEVVDAITRGDRIRTVTVTESRRR